MATSFVSFIRLRIGWRLALGFSAMVIILAAAIALTQLRVGEISALFQRVNVLRVPTSHASTTMAKEINASLASLRGWMLTGNQAFKSERAAVWREIDALVTEIDALSAKWTNAENVARWGTFKPLLAEFRQAQKQVEDIAHSENQFEANRILVNQAAPAANIMANRITLMIDEEKTLPATAGRKAVLGMMADVRGSMGLGLANIRAYLLTGDETFRDNFDTFWATNTQRFTELGNASHLFTPTQAAAFKELAAARTEFDPLPPRMFEIRASETHDMANFLLVTQAAPRADKLLTILSGAKNTDGRRAGGMVADQLGLLSTDADLADSTAADLQQFLWILLMIGVTLAVVIGLLLVWSIVKPIRQMTLTMADLARGDRSVVVPALDRHDEIGEMAKAVQVFKANGEQIVVMEEAADNIIASISQTTNQVAAAVAQQSASASQQAAAVSQTSTSLEEIRHSAESTMERANQLTASSQRTLRSGESNRQEMNNVINAMGDIREKVEAIAHTMVVLSEQTRRVGEITNSVSTLAQQSKMLAINASIEAAKAGDSGKGFAVVAEEVANLAEQSEQATVQVRSVLDQIQAASEKAIFATEEGTKQVDAGVALIHIVDGGLGKLLEVIDDTVSSTQQMIESIRQQTAGIQQTADAMTDITQGTNQTAATSSQIRAAIDALTIEVTKLRSVREGA